MEGGEKLNIFWYRAGDRGKYISIGCFVKRSDDIWKSCRCLKVVGLYVSVLVFRSWISFCIGSRGLFDKRFWMEGGEKLNIFWYGDADRGKEVGLRCFAERSDDIWKSCRCLKVVGLYVSVVDFRSWISFCIVSRGLFDKRLWMEGGEKLNIFWYGDEDRDKDVSLRCFVERWDDISKSSRCLKVAC